MLRSEISLQYNVSIENERLGCFTGDLQRPFNWPIGPKIGRPTGKMSIMQDYQYSSPLYALMFKLILFKYSEFQFAAVTLEINGALRVYSG